MNIRVDLSYPIKDGTEVVFRSPIDCSDVTGLKVYYIGDNGLAESKEFVLADAHGNNVGCIPHLFAENVVVKVILDVTTSMAFVQNADTNAYLEGRFAEAVTHTPQTLSNEQKAQARENIGAVSEKDLTQPKELTESWASLAARIKQGDFTGINVGDYKVADMNTTHGEFARPAKFYVMGIDTYYGVGNAGNKVPHHIDFITFDIAGADKMNTTNTNNGTAAEKNPWRASFAYQAMNFGIYDLTAIPLYVCDAEPHIIDKMAQLYNRYSASGSATNPTGWSANTFSSMGKYWIPSEKEVMGSAVQGDTGYAISGGGCNAQYELFRKFGLKHFCQGDTDKVFWLCTPKANNDTAFCAIKSNGNLTTYTAAYSTNMYYPVCFRIG